MKAHPGVSVGIVCPVRGGTRIEHWKKGETTPWPLFDTAVKVTNESLSAGGELKGILWHQGEGNSSSALVAIYPAQLRQLIADFRAVFKKPDLPIVYSQIGQFNPGYAAFNKMIVNQPAVIPRTACIVTDGLKNIDAWHFDSAGQRTLGQRYAKAMLGLIQAAASE
jgi:Carbohydrate esterase, sialic acid-specific acetylesterase